LIVSAVTAPRLAADSIPEEPGEILRALFGDAGRAAPNSLLHRMREVAPVYYDDASQIWYLFRWHDCNSTLRSDRFGQAGRLQLDPRFATSDALRLIADNISFKDPPDHARLRSFAQKAFTGPAVARMRGYLDTQSHHVLDELAGREQFDVVNDYAARIPSTVICEMLGVPREDHPKFDSWIADQFRLLSPEPPSDQLLAEVDASTRAFSSYIVALIEERRRAPREDLISRFVAVSDDPGSPVTQAELVAMVVVLLAGGSDTTKFVISMGIRSLIQHRDQAQWLRQDPTREPRAFEEFLRLYGPIVMGNLRKSYDDLEISGVRIRAGDSVVPVLLAANLDPAVFTEPDQLNLARHPNPHLAFGGGIHSCLGMMLARLVAPFAISLVNRRLPRLELVDEVLDMNPSLFSLRGLRSLRVRQG
jgi:cytochrome P450